MTSLVHRRRDVARSLLVTGLLLLIGPLAHAEEMTWEQLKTIYHAEPTDDARWKKLGFSPSQSAKWVDRFASQEFIKTLGDEKSRLGIAGELVRMGVPIEQAGMTVKIALKAMKEDIQPFAFMMGVDPDSLNQHLESRPLLIAAALFESLEEAGLSPSESRRLIQACNQMVQHKTFLANPNVYANKGKCTSIQATVQQMTASNEGLFTAYEETEATRGYFKQSEYGGGEQRIFLTFDKPFTNRGVHGLARIEGNYTYTSQAGWQITVPHLRMIAELRPPPPEKLPEGTGASE